MADWRRGGVLYQIYPRSFADANGDGVGDLKGVTQHLEHVARLGVDGIWLSPFFASPMKDYGYDVSNYCDVDPIFGTLADFDALLKRAHELGLKVVIDQVYSHSSDQHPWFSESRASRDNPKADWYVWADPKPDGSPPNNWLSRFGGPAWTWDARRRQYYFHNFLSSQPDLNVRNPEVADALLAAARFWLERGVDGFRLDVVNMYTHDEQLRDNPARALNRPASRPIYYQHNLYNISQPDTLAFIARLRALTDSFTDRYLVGEIADDDPLARQRDYTNGADRLHSAYSFFLLNARRATPTLFHEAMAGWDNAAGAPAWSFSNHDVWRHSTRLGDDNPQRVRMLMALLLCLRGVIYLYQGDELGLPHADVPFDRLVDPPAIAFWPADGSGRDGARTPMPWRRDANMAGFTQAADAWLPLDPRHRALSVDAQESDAQSMLAFTRQLIALRKAHGALQDGSWRSLDAPDGVLLFERVGAEETLRCAFNLDAGEINLEDAALAAAEASQTIGAAQRTASGYTLAPNSAVIARVV